MSNLKDVNTLSKRFAELQKKREEDKLIKEIAEGEVIQLDAACKEKKSLNKNFLQSDTGQESTTNSKDVNTLLKRCKKDSFKRQQQVLSDLRRKEIDKELQKKREADKLIKEIVEGKAIQVNGENEKKSLNKNSSESDAGQELKSPTEEKCIKRNKFCSVL